MYVITFGEYSGERVVATFDLYDDAARLLRLAGYTYDDRNTNNGDMWWFIRETGQFPDYATIYRVPHNKLGEV